MNTRPSTPTPQASPATSKERFAPFPEGYTSSPCGAEERIHARWKEQRVFETIQTQRAGEKPFVFWEGPPTANGRPGIHHVFSRTLKDAICRFQTMQGRLVLRKAGWDTHGLPVELEVEKSLSISGKHQIEAYGVAAFNERCRESVWKYRSEWEKLSSRIGFWLDYEHPYVTYAPEYVDSLWFLLARMHKAGLAYRGKRVLPYCGRCGTGLSSHELGQPGVYRDLSDPSVIVRFPLANQAGNEAESFLAWTTTPWTLPSNVALAVHPERDYVRVRVPLPVPKGETPGARGYEICWLVAERVQAVFGKQAVELERKQGAQLLGQRYLAPFEGTAIPEVEPGSWTPTKNALHSIVLAEYVTVEDGTGIVHQAPSYGADDWDTAKRYQLPVLQAVGPAGRFVCTVGGVAEGTFFKEADEALMADLKSRERMLKNSRENHSYPHCWRCDTALLYFASPAWYLRTSEYSQRMAKENQQIRWIPPEIGSKRFGEWLENNVDWNISRDRYWGTPLPFWVCEGCGAEEAIESAKMLAERAGGLPQGFDHHKPSVDQVTFACRRCSKVMRRTQAVVDCWFDSGAMPYAQHGWPHVPGSDAALRQQFPADYICEGLDQTRGWFYTLHAIGSFVASQPEWKLGPAPAYRACLVNGLVLDKDGVKMSKRLGNVLDPWKAIEEHGADSVRWYLLSSAAPWLPKRFDPAGMSEARRKLFATLAHSYQFFREYARIDKFDPVQPGMPPREQWTEMDRWITSRTQSLLAKVKERLSNFDLPSAAREIERFAIDDLSNWYIRRNRRRFWKGETGADKLAAYGALHRALSAVALCLAPLTPYLAEMLWERLSGSERSVHGERLPEAKAEWIDLDLERSMELVQRAVVMGRALRESVGIKIRQPLRALHLRSSNPRALELLGKGFAAHELLEELNVKSIGSLAADDGKVVLLSAKANFRVLGKILGPRMKEAAERIQALGPADLQRLRLCEEVGIDVSGETVLLTLDMVEIRVESQASFPVETDGELILWLDTELDEGLIAEGLAREVVNRVNTQRKELGLAVEDRVRLRFATTSAPLRRSLERYEGLIRGETLAVEYELVEALAQGSTAAAPQDRFLFDFGEGHILAVWISAVGTCGGASV